MFIYPCGNAAHLFYSLFFLLFADYKSNDDYYYSQDHYCRGYSAAETVKLKAAVSSRQRATKKAVFLYSPKKAHSHKLCAFKIIGFLLRTS